VAIGPGATALTRIDGACSTASVRVIATTPPFAAV
jgi:hypothetical protein